MGKEGNVMTGAGRFQPLSVSGGMVRDARAVFGPRRR